MLQIMHQNLSPNLFHNLKMSNYVPGDIICSTNQVTETRD